MLVNVLHGCAVGSGILAAASGTTAQALFAAPPSLHECWLPQMQVCKHFISSCIHTVCCPSKLPPQVLATTDAGLRAVPKDLLPLSPTLLISYDLPTRKVGLALICIAEFCALACHAAAQPHAAHQLRPAHAQGGLGLYLRC